MLTIGSLFSGIGGLEIGLEAGGLGPVLWQVEIDEFCRRVLAKHWPDVERFDDVRAVGVGQLRAVDVICGGFPCQDLSVAGKRRGIDGPRSGLWREFARIVGEMRPRYVVVENVRGLTGAALARVLADLRLIGYAVEPPIKLRALDVGAPHLRPRLFIVAHADGEGEPQQARPLGEERRRAVDGGCDRRGRLWPTPMASNYGFSRGGGAGRCGPIRKSLRALAQEEGAPLNPEWVECLMGFPPNWTRIDGPRVEVASSSRGSRRARKASRRNGASDSQHSETQSCLSAPPSSDGALSISNGGGS